MKFFTKVLTSGTFSISASDGAMSLSIQANDSSSCTFIGGIAFKGENPSALTIESGKGLSVLAKTPALDGIVITHVSGTINIIVGF